MTRQPDQPIRKEIKESYFIFKMTGLATQF